MQGRHVAADLRDGVGSALSALVAAPRTSRVASVDRVEWSAKVGGNLGLTTSRRGTRAALRENPAEGSSVLLTEMGAEIRLRSYDPGGARDSVLMVRRVE